MSGLEAVMLKSLLHSVFFIKALSRGRLGYGRVSEYNISNINLILQCTKLDKENTTHTPEVYI
jgi:hypothetical protein